MAINIMTWEIDFAAMKAKIHTQVVTTKSLDENVTHVNLVDVDGHLCFYYPNDPHRKPKIVANMGHSAFDSAVKRAWSDFCFEEHILNSKGEGCE